jgi:MFS family permease
LQAYGVGNGLGAALGGFLCDKLGWRAAFYVQLPFIAVYGVLAVLSCPDNLGPNLAKTQGKTIRESFGSFDAYGTIGMVLTVSGLILGVNLGGNVFTWTHPFVISSLVVAVIAGVGLVLVERKAKRPILPLRLFTTRPVANVIGSNFVASMTVNAVLFNVPLYLQAVRQTSPTTSGFYLFPPLFGASITAIAAGFYITLTRRLKPPMIVGSLSALGGAIAVTCLSADTPARLVPWLIPFVSIGQGAFFPAATIAVLALNSQEDQAVATTTLGLVRSLGSILGVALSSWVLQNALPIYLNKYVTAPDTATKEHIIRTVRESIRSIRHLDPLHKKQVINAYASSLRATFIVAIAFATVSALLILPARLPRLQRQEDMDDPEAEDGVYLPEDRPDYETTSSEDEGDVDDESALLATPTRTITRTTTRGTSHSRTRPLSRRSTSFGEPIERRASFDMSF